MRSLVTIKTDGFRDYVILADGTERNLGSVSVLKMVVESAQSPREARKTLDQFLKRHEAVYAADTEKLLALLAPKRARWSSFDKALFRTDSEEATKKVARHPKSRARDIMAIDSELKNAVSGMIAGIEKHIAVLEQSAKEAAPGSLTAQSVKGDVEGLKALIGQLKDPAAAYAGKDQSANKTYYGLKSAHDVLAGNSDTAQHILDRVAATNDKIDDLVAQGRRFNAALAKSDLLKVTQKLASVLTDMDLAHPGVADDLNVLAARADEIHALFV